MLCLDRFITIDGQVLRGRQNANGSRSKTWEEVPDADGNYEPKVLSETDARAAEQRNLQQYRGVNDLATKPGKSDSAKANMDYINSQAFADKFKDKYANPDVENAVVKACRQIIKNRNGTKFEEAFFINANTGETISYIKGKKESGINMPKKLKNRLTNAPSNSIIMIHNHPNSSPLSTEDYSTSTKYASLYETIACGYNGDVYVFRNTYGTGGKMINYVDGTTELEAVRDFRIAFSKNKCRLNMDDFEARHAAWNAVSDLRRFYYEKR